MRVFEIKANPVVLLERNAINTDQPFGGQDAINQLIQGLQGRANTDAARKWLGSALRRYLTDRHEDVTDVTDQVVKAVAAGQWTGLPAWMKKDPEKLLQRLQGGEQIFVVNLSQEFRDHLTGLVDYLNSLGERSLARLSAEDAFQHAQQWHADMAVQAKRQAVDAQEDWANVHPVMQWADGYEMVRLTSEKALDYESDRLDHCVGRGGYDKKVREGTAFIYSLRNEANQPSVSLEVDPATKTVKQIKSTRNGAPPDTVWSHIKDFIIRMGFAVEGDGRHIGLKEYAGLWFEAEALETGRGHEVMRFGDGTTVEKLDAFGAASGTLNAVMTLVRDGNPLTFFGVQAGKVVSFSSTAKDHAKHLRAAIRSLNIPVAKNGETIGLHRIGGAYFTPEDIRTGQEVARIGDHALVAIKPFSGEVDPQNAAYSIPLPEGDPAFIGVEHGYVSQVEQKTLPPVDLLAMLRHIGLPLKVNLKLNGTGLRLVKGKWFEPPREEDRFDQLGDFVVVHAREFNVPDDATVDRYLVGPQIEAPWLMTVKDNVLVEITQGGGYRDNGVTVKTSEMWEFFKRHRWGVVMKGGETVSSNYQFISESYQTAEGWLFDPKGDYQTVFSHGTAEFRRLLGYNEAGEPKRDFEAYGIFELDEKKNTGRQHPCFAVQGGAISAAKDSHGYKKEIQAFLSQHNLKVRSQEIARHFDMTQIGDHYYHTFSEAVAGGESEDKLNSWLSTFMTIDTRNGGWREEWFAGMTPEAGKAMVDWLGAHYLINPLVAAEYNRNMGEHAYVRWGEHKLYAYSKTLPSHLNRVLWVLRQQPEMLQRAKATMASFFDLVARSNEVIAFTYQTLNGKEQPDDWVTLFKRLDLDLVRLLGTGNLQRGRNALPIVQEVVEEAMISDNGDQVGSVSIHYFHDNLATLLTDYTRPDFGLFDRSLFPEIGRIVHDKLVAAVQHVFDHGDLVDFTDDVQHQRYREVFGRLGIDINAVMAGIDRSAFDDIADGLEDVLQETEDLLEPTGDEPFEFENHDIKNGFFTTLARLLPQTNGVNLLTPRQTHRAIEMLRDSISRWLDKLAANPFPLCFADMEERNAFEDICHITGLMPRVDEVRNTMEAAMKPLLDQRHKEAIQEKLDEASQDIHFGDGFEPDNKDIHNDALKGALKAMGIEYRSFDSDLERAIDAAVEEWIDDQGFIHGEDWSNIDEHPPEVNLDGDDDDDDDDWDEDDEDEDDGEDDDEPPRTVPDFDFATFWKEYAKAAYGAWETQERDYNDNEYDDWRRSKESDIESELKDDYDLAEQYIDYVLDYQLGWHEMDRIKSDPSLDRTGRPIRKPSTGQLSLGV